MDEWDQYMTLTVKALKFNHRVKMGEAVQQETVGRGQMELKKPRTLADFFKCLLNLKGIRGFCVISPLGKLTFKTANFSLKLFKAPTLLKFAVKFSRFSFIMY